MQSEKIRQWQPWKNSTEPKTLKGKAISSRKVFKGCLMQELTELRKLLLKQENKIKEVTSILI